MSRPADAILRTEVRVPRGFRWAALAAGIKQSGAPDLALAEAEAGSRAAAIFTTNLVVAAPLVVDRKHLKASRGAIRAVLVNSGNANCATGNEGIRHAGETCRVLARELRVDLKSVFPSSTGVIGVPLPAHKITAALPYLVPQLAATPAAFTAFARAIMTTDTRMKVGTASVRCRDGEGVVAGCAKGAGMIHPNMATMLAYIFTDAEVSARDLQRALTTAAAGSFNSISVDGDTSTNDTLLVIASGAAGAPRKRSEFQEALDSVCSSLAEQIVRDGEGVQHVVRLHIEEARNEAEALQIGRTIATSALVKTAWAGADPNWGRILAAAGRAGIKFDPNRVSVWFGKQCVCRKGVAQDFDEQAAHAYLAQPEFDIAVRLGRGRARVTLLTCDLTAEYVRINADYRT